MADFFCDWCGNETGVRLPLVTKVEMFDPNTGQRLFIARTEKGFCRPQCRINWIREP